MAYSKNVMKDYKDLSSQAKQVRRLWLLMIVAACGMVMGSQLSNLLALFRFVT